jgi:hypothetical protein
MKKNTKKAIVAGVAIAAAAGAAYLYGTKSGAKTRAKVTKAVAKNKVAVKKVVTKAKKIAGKVNKVAKNTCPTKESSCSKEEGGEKIISLACSIKKYSPMVSIF